MAISPKVSAATVGAALTTIVAGIVGPHLFPHATPADVQGLVEAVLTALVTFGSGWFARDRDVQRVEAAVKPVVKDVETVYTQIKQAAAPVAVADPPAVVFQPGAGVPPVAQPITPVLPR